jgi:phytoene/squalene synthetase
VLERVKLARVDGRRHLGRMSLADLVRRHDPDRFLTALFAPMDKRDNLLTLYAFNHELARAREVVSEPPLALIRLQWWREVVEGAQRRHEVAEPLAAAIEAGALDRELLLAMIDAREIEVEPAIETLSDWHAYLFGAAGGVAVAKLLRPLRLPRRAIAAALPAILARRDLSRAPPVPLERGAGDRLAVTLAGLAGRV